MFLWFLWFGADASKSPYSVTTKEISALILAWITFYHHWHLVSKIKSAQEGVIPRSQVVAYHLFPIILFSRSSAKESWPFSRSRASSWLHWSCSHWRSGWWWQWSVWCSCETERTLPQFWRDKWIPKSYANQSQRRRCPFSCSIFSWYEYLFWAEAYHTSQYRAVPVERTDSNSNASHSCHATGKRHPCHRTNGFRKDRCVCDSNFVETSGPEEARFCILLWGWKISLFK